MAETHEFSTLEEALKVFPDLPYAQVSGVGVQVENSKTGEFADVAPGQHIVKIADRFEVHDEAPAKAHEAEAPEPEAPAEPVEAPDPTEQPAGTDLSNPQVDPSQIGAPAGTPAAPAESLDAADAPAAE